MARMRPGFGMPLDFAAIRDGVDESGFQMLSLEAELRGSLSGRRGADGKLRPAIGIGAGGQSFWILEGKSLSEREAYAELQHYVNTGHGAASLLVEAPPEMAGEPSVVLKQIL